VSFLLDPPLLLAGGAAIERVAPDGGTANALSLATVGTFVGISAALYANAPGLGLLWKPFGSRSGREFMLTSGLAPIEEDGLRWWQHAAALSVFATYPAWLALGRRLARR
jgi:hypothetical protein